MSREGEVIARHFLATDSEAEARCDAMRCEEDEVGTTNYFPPPKMPLRVFLGSEGRRISFCSQITRYVFIYTEGEIKVCMSC